MTTSYERGVSEVVAFLLVFAVLLSVSLAGAVYGVESLETATAGEATHANDRALMTLRADLADLTHGATARSTIVRLPAGQLSFGDPIEVRVVVETTGTRTDLVRVTSTPIVVGVGKASGVYEAGAVTRVYPNSATVVARPSWRIDPDQTLLTLVDTRPIGGPTAVGSDSAGIESRVLRTEVASADPPAAPQRVELTIETPRAAAWGRAFDHNPHLDTVTVDDKASTVTIAFDTAAIAVKTTVIGVRLAG